MTYTKYDIERLQKKVADLQAQLHALRNALQALYDEQNGPPLIRAKGSWQAAMDEAERLLGTKGGK